MDLVPEVLKAVAGGIIASSITLYVNGYRLDKDIERAARTLAIQLTDIFERFGLECAAIPNQHAANGRDNPYDYSGIAALPTVPDLPSDDAGWRALDTVLAIDARTFATRRRQSGNVVSGIAEYGDADDIEGEVEDQAIVLGDAAWNLALRFRERYKLGATHVDWNIADHFKQGFARIAQEKAENVVYAAEMRAEMEGRTDND